MSLPVNNFQNRTVTTVFYVIPYDYLSTTIQTYLNGLQAVLLECLLTLKPKQQRWRK
jgi:hypothetical protein